MGQGTEYQIEEAYEETSLSYYMEQPSTNTIDRMLNQYNKNKPIAKGGLVRCPSCNKLFVKKTPTHSFCSNGRNKKGGNCKDRFWNTVSDERRERAKAYKKI